MRFCVRELGGWALVLLGRWLLGGHEGFLGGQGPRRGTANGASPPCKDDARRPGGPPGTRSRSQGLRTGPKPEFSFDEPMENSSMFVLPRTGAPALTSRSTDVAV